MDAEHRVPKSRLKNTTTLEKKYTIISCQVWMSKSEQTIPLQPSPNATKLQWQCCKKLLLPAVE